MNADGSGFTALNAPMLDGAQFRATNPTWSPDGQFIAFAGSRQGRDVDVRIYVMGKDGSGLHALTDPTAVVLPNHPTWSPDGQSIAFDAYHGEASRQQDIYVMQANGTNPHLVTHTGANLNPSWSPDSRRIAFMSARSGGKYNIYIMNADGTNIRRVTYNSSWDGESSWSPDGKRLAFASTRREEEAWALYTVNIDGTGLRRVVGDLPVVDPAWRPAIHP
jgi:TolB protein